MTLIRHFEPFREIDTLQKEMNRLFEQFNIMEPNGLKGIAFVPPAEISETDDDVRLRLEIPGIDRDDLNVEVTAEAVAVSGERKAKMKEESAGKTRTEFRYGKFQRVISLPTRVKNQEAQAEYKDGILSLVLPKAEPEKNRVFKVALG